ncbi:MAG: cytochrome C, partial [Acidiferrobacter thiooxydans]
MTSIIGGLAMSANAWALPSFARQTGWSCATCHTSYPQLTPMGRIFKLMGYTTTNLQPQQKVEAKVGNVVHLLLPRISQFSIFVQASDTHVAGGQQVLGASPRTSTTPGQPPGQPVGTNNNLEVPQQVSLFYAGEVTPHVGDFLHITYSGQGGFAFDDSSIVRAQAWKLGLHNTLITGVDVNNTPSATDLWNTSPDWQAPFFTSDYTAEGAVPTTFIGSSPGAAFPLIGLGAYAADIVGPNRANWFYAEADAYNNSEGIGAGPNSGVIGEGGGNQYTLNNSSSCVADSANCVAFGQLAGTAPYLRLAYQHDWSDWNWEVGTYDMWSRVYASPVSNAVDRFYDYDLDSQLQWLDINDNSNVTVRANLIHEDARFAADDVGPTSGSSNTHGQLNTFNLNATYWYHDEYGAQGGFQDVTGTANSHFWGGNVYTSANGSPNTTDEWVEASYLPWWNTRLSVRYTVFNKFRGLTGNN